MGLFNLFNKKKDEEENNPAPEDQMLTLNERQKPTKKSDTTPPRPATAPPSSDTIPPQMQSQAEGVLLTPDPEVNNGSQTVYNFEDAPGPEPQDYARENLATKSLEKNIKEIPNVKKLVIPSNDDNMATQVNPTDSVVAERVKLKQVDLSGGEKQEQIAAAQNNYIPGEFIDIPLNFFTEKIPAHMLAPNAMTLFDNSSTIRFTKDEILSIMAQGVFAVVGSALLARFPGDMISENGKSTSEVLEFPLEGILPLIPPDWFMIQGQDESLNKSLENMDNPFQDLESPQPEEEISEKRSNLETQSEIKVSVFDDEDEETVAAESLEKTQQDSPVEKASVFDPEETMVQPKPVEQAPAAEPEPEENTFDPDETIVQKKPPIVADLIKSQAATQAAPVDKAETDDTTLVVPIETIKASLKPDIFFNIPNDASLKIPRDRVLASLSEGVFKFTAKEIDLYAGTSAVDGSRENEEVIIDLGLVMGLIPPEWFALQGQDSSQTDMLNNMSDIFDDNTFEEAAKELEEAQSTGEETTDPAADETDEETIAPVVEEDEEEGSDLITGGAFGKMNALFADDEDEEEEIVIEEEQEEASSQLLEEEQMTAATVDTKPESEEETEQPALQAPKVEEVKPAIQLTPPKTEEEAASPVLQAPKVEEEKPAIQLTPPKPEEEIAPPEVEEEVVEDLDALQTITINRDSAKVFDEARIAKEQEEITTPLSATEEPVAKKASEPEEPVTSKIPTPEEPAVVETPTEAASIEPKTAAGAGVVTHRPIADEVPDVNDKTILRPSTAPNGIDINRSNLKDLCRLHSAGEKLAQTLIEYREQNGDFKSINELINVPGVGTSVYRSLTGLRPSSDLVAAERRINKVVGFDEDKDYPLGKIITKAQEEFNFKSIILSDKDGFEICSSGDKTLLESNSELLAATTPQLFKRTRHFLKQSNLPHPSLFTFYLEDTPVTFGIADEVFMVMVHSNSWPEPKHMKKCRTLINEMAWFCSYRAIV